MKGFKEFGKYVRKACEGGCKKKNAIKGKWKAVRRGEVVHILLMNANNTISHKSRILSHVHHRIPRSKSLSYRQISTCKITRMVALHECLFYAMYLT